MSNKIIYSFLFVSALTIYGCTDDFLEEQHPTKETGAAVLNTPEDARLAANGLYQGIHVLYGHNEPSLWYFDEMRGDDVTIDMAYLDRRAERCLKYYGISYGEESEPIEDLWVELYKNIYHCNWVIESVEGNDNLSAAVQDEILSQAYFMRGFYFYNLVRLWGDVPLVLSTPKNRDEFKPAKNDEEEVWNAVLDDMETAAAMQGLAPEVADQDGNKNKGYANEAVIHAMAARAYLYRPSANKTEDYNSVVRHAQAVIDIGVFELEDPYTNVYSMDGDVWQTKNKEVIWHRGSASQFSLNGKFLDDNTRYALRSAPPGISAGRALVETTGTYTGSRPGRAIWASGPEIAQMLQQAYINDGDIRITESFYYPAYKNHTDPNNDVFVEIDSEIALNEWFSDKNTGAPLYFYKFRYSNTTVTDAQEMIYNSVTPSIIRYADVLLMMAEAKAGLGESQPLINGKTPLQLIMERAGRTSGWEDESMENILDQRRMELVGEWQRVPDLIRLGKFAEAHENKKNALTDDYTVPWMERYTYLPIPRRELEINENLRQNDLWR